MYIYWHSEPSVLDFFGVAGETAFHLRKEVISPQIPLRRPCYDFIPITDPTLNPLYCYEKSLGSPNFRNVTGGVCKTRERIHRSISDLRLLAIPTSCGRVSAHNPN